MSGKVSNQIFNKTYMSINNNIVVHENTAAFCIYAVAYLHIHFRIHNLTFTNEIIFMHKKRLKLPVLNLCMIFSKFEVK